MHAPERRAGADVALLPTDFLYLKLTGARVTDPSEAPFTFGNFCTDAYDGEVVAALGLNVQRRLRPRFSTMRPTRSLSAGVATQEGLPTSTPVSLAFIDTFCTVLGADIVKRLRPRAARC